MCRSAKVAGCIDEASSWWLRVFPSPRSLHFESSVTLFVLNFLWEKKVCVWESRNAAAEFVSSNSWTFKKELDCPVRQELFPLLSFSFCSSLLTRFTVGSFAFWLRLTESLKLWGTHLFYFCWQFSFVPNTHCASVVGFKLALGSDPQTRMTAPSSLSSLTSSQTLRANFLSQKNWESVSVWAYGEKGYRKSFWTCFGKKTTVIEVLQGNILQFPWV